MNPTGPRKTPPRPVSKKQMQSLRQHAETRRQLGNVEGCCKGLVEIHGKVDSMDRESMENAVMKNQFLLGSLERINKHGITAGILQRPVTPQELVEWLHAIAMRQRRNKKRK
jgi:hypothetical protein